MKQVKLSRLLSSSSGRESVEASQPSPHSWTTPLKEDSLWGRWQKSVELQESGKHICGEDSMTKKKHNAQVSVWSTTMWVTTYDKTQIQWHHRVTHRLTNRTSRPQWCSSCHLSLARQFKIEQCEHTACVLVFVCEMLNPLFYCSGSWELRLCSDWTHQWHSEFVSPYYNLEQIFSLNTPKQTLVWDQEPSRTHL